VLQRRVLAWLDYETVATDAEDEAADVVMRLEKAPALLAEVLQIAVQHTQMDKVVFIAGLESDVHKEAFAIECLNKMVLKTCCANTVLATTDIPCTAMHLVLSGSIVIEHVQVQDHSLALISNGTMGAIKERLDSKLHHGEEEQRVQRAMPTTALAGSPRHLTRARALHCRWQGGLHGA